MMIGSKVHPARRRVDRAQPQPDEFRFLSIQLEAVAGHPLAHDLDAVSETDGELGCITGKTVIIEL